jgi:PAS domain S-box-containing protein
MKLAALIYQSNTDAIVVTDESNLIVDVNPAFTLITGYTRDEVLGKDPKLMKSGRHDKVFYQQMWQTILEQGQWQGEIWDRHKNGGVYIKNRWQRVSPCGAIYRHYGKEGKGRPDPMAGKL